MLFPDLVDVPIEVFGGYSPAVPPQDLPSGAAAIAQDVIFPLGALRSRGGLRNVFANASPIPVNASINGLKSWITATLGQRLLAWDSLANLYKETPEGTLNIVGSRPYRDLFYQSTSLFGREYQAFFDASGGHDIPRQYDDMNWDRVSQGGPGAAPNAADSATAGNIPVGNHQVSVAFITRQGFITKASPPRTWAAAGNFCVALTNIPTGPPNVVARLILFTPVIIAPATTGSFYSLPVGTTQLVTPTTMVINDNTTTAASFDFTDTILQAGFQANYLFSQLELGESAFCIGYDSRLVWLGERNHVPNLLNTGFDGGFVGAPALAAAGPNAPSVAANAGVVGVAWANPNNVFVEDGAVATAIINPLGTPVPNLNRSMALQASGFGFAIPSNATITGIVVKAKVKGSDAIHLTDYSVKMLKAGVVSGSEHANGNIWTAALAFQTYGSSADLWGALWTYSDINLATFGVQYQTKNLDTVNNRTASIDFISITVSYTTPAGAVGPLGWTLGAAFAGGNSALSSSYTADWGDAFSITGDGATAKRGEINQSAYQDYLRVPVINRNTAYRVRARVASANGLTAGTLHINLTSITGAFTTGGLTVQAVDLAATYQEFDAMLTTAIVSPPVDMLLQVYVDGTPNNGGSFLVDSIEVYPENVPFNYSTARLSHAFNPESYDSTLGQIQVRPSDGQQFRAAFPLRANLYLAKDHYLCYTTDDGVNEPASWSINEVSSTIGICGPNACDWTEEWAVFAERSGLYIVWGSDPAKISQEIAHDASGTGRVAWDSINWQYGHTIWVRIDQANRMILVGAPVNGATTPNRVFMLDYRWLESASDIAGDPLLTYSAFTGKMIAHGKGRRWATWSITANAMCFAERADGTVQPFFGNGVANGKIYQQIDAAAQPSDDGLGVPWTYQTYSCPSHMEEQMLQLGAHRKLAGYLKLKAIGAGLLGLAISTMQRTTLLRSYQLSLSPAGDGERPLNVHGERFAITIRQNEGAENWFQLEKLVLCLRKENSIPVRGASF